MIKKKFGLIAIAAMTLGFTSCLKEGLDNIDPSKGTPNVVEFANTGSNVSSTATSTYPRYNIDLGVIKVDQTVEFDLNISYSGVEFAAEDLTVNFAVDTAALTLFNKENSTTYSAPPAAIFVLPASAVIKKGTQTATVKIGVKNNASYDFNKSYALPVKIASVSKGTISSNFGKAVYSFSARNNYDGIYTMSSTAPMVDVTSATLTGYYPLKMQLRTFSGNSVALYDAYKWYSQDYFHPILSGTSVSGYGAFSPLFYFDATGKITAVGNYYGPNAGGNLRSGVINPAGVNKITFKADGTVDYFEVSYIMTQSVSTPNSPRTYFYEKYTRTGAR